MHHLLILVVYLSVIRYTFYLLRLQANLPPSPSYAFGIRHSPYIGSLKGDDWVSARTETKSYPVASTTTKQEVTTVSCNGVPVVNSNTNFSNIGSGNSNTVRESKVNWLIRILKSSYFNSKIFSSAITLISLPSILSLNISGNWRKQDNDNYSHA